MEQLETRFCSPAPTATAEKLRVPATPGVPAPKHQRWSGGLFGTVPPDGLRV